MEIGKTIILMGVAFIIIGAIVLYAGKLPGIGKLPGDIVIKRENFTLYFPIVTSLIISLILSFIFLIWGQK